MFLLEMLVYEVFSCRYGGTKSFPSRPVVCDIMFPRKEVSPYQYELLSTSLPLNITNTF